MLHNNEQYEIKFFFKENPFIKIIIPFILGIIFQDLVKTNTYFSVCCWFCFFILYTILEFKPLENKIKSKQFTKILFVFILFFTAIILHQINTKTRNVNILQEKIFIATISEPVIENPKTFRTVINLHQSFLDSKSKTIKEKIICYFSKQDSSFYSNKYKNYTLIIRANLEQIATPKTNLGTFDFGTYYERRQIFYQTFLSKNNYQFIDSSEKTFFPKILLKSQDWVNQTIQKYIPDKKYYGLLEALLIGYKIDLDKQLLQDYISSGTIHIIAISGLHLGFIYMLLSLLLKRLNKNLKQKIVQSILIISVLFFYALIANASPSILRAAFMFSIITIGKINNKKTSIFNLLGASAFIILCYNTQMLFDLGFILSYVAIISLVLFNTYFHSLFYIKNKIANFITEIISTSIAAQILIIPILAYLFYYIPTYVILNNLIAVPLSTVILFFSLLLLLFSLITPIGFLLGKAIAMLITIMNTTIQISNSLPLSQYKIPFFSLIDCFFYYLIIIGILLFYKYKKIRHLQLTLLVLLLLTISRFISFYKIQQQEKIILYKDNKNNIIETITGNYATVYIGDSIDNNYLSLISPTHQKLGIEKFNVILSKKNLVLKKDSNTIIYLTHFNKNNVYPSIPCKYLILNKEVLKDIHNLLEYFKCEYIILDNSCKKYHIEKINTAIKDTHKIHSLFLDGTWIL